MFRGSSVYSRDNYALYIYIVYLLYYTAYVYIGIHICVCSIFFSMKMIKLFCTFMYLHMQVHVCESTLVSKCPFICASVWRAEANLQYHLLQ